MISRTTSKFVVMLRKNFFIPESSHSHHEIFHTNCINFTFTNSVQGILRRCYDGFALKVEACLQQDPYSSCLAEKLDAPVIQEIYHYLVKAAIFVSLVVERSIPVKSATCNFN